MQRAGSRPAELSRAHSSSSGPFAPPCWEQSRRCAKMPAIQGESGQNSSYRSHHSGNGKSLEPGSILSASPLKIPATGTYSLSVLVFRERQFGKLVPEGRCDRHHTLRPYFRSLVSLLELLHFWEWSVGSRLFREYNFPGLLLEYPKYTPGAVEYGTHATATRRSPRKTISKEYSGRVTQHCTPSEQWDPI